MPGFEVLLCHRIHASAESRRNGKPSVRRRSSGVLLHPTSLPGPWGIGDLGPAAHRFIDWLADAGQSVWQVLPVGPTGFGDSPYGAASSFAGNPLLVSPDALIAEELLPESAPAAEAGGSGLAVDFGEVPATKEAMLRESWRHVQTRGDAETDRELAAFRAAPDQSWLADWALYAALKRENGERAWHEWPTEVRRRDPDALERARTRLNEEIRFHSYVQFLFHRQWAALRTVAQLKGIRILGDLPIYVAPDSADAWVDQDLFDLDDSGKPKAVAGVPPDAFSETGQRWGNPLYLWDRMRDTGYRWWISRVRVTLQRVDLLRLDHFRGFAGYWRIPAEAEDARGGAWVPGPGAELFSALEDALGQLPLIAEDLGVITPDVVALKERFGLPGMKVLHFGFGTADSDHLPHHHVPEAIVYPGTHDNDTSRGWFASLGREERRRVLDYLGCTAGDVHWAMVRAALTSVARLAVIPAQDLLGLGSEARMNTPARGDGNWTWRLAPGQLDSALARRLRRLTTLAGRLVAPPTAN
jgi:4-alpha-glucanotransferase